MLSPQTMDFIQRNMKKLQFVAAHQKAGKTVFHAVFQKKIMGKFKTFPKTIRAIIQKSDPDYFSKIFREQTNGNVF